MPVRRSHLLIRATGVAALAALACAWVVGRVCSDRYLWSQPVSWAPPLLLAAPVWVATLASLLRARRVRRRGGPGRGRAVLRGAGVVFGAVSLAHLVFVELGLHRLVLRSDPGVGSPLRLVFWNQAGHLVPEPAPSFLAESPSLMVSANRNSGTPRDEVIQAMLDTGEADAVRGWPFDLFSRLPITRWATTSLGLDGRSRITDGSMRADTGWAAWFEVRTDSGPLVIWAIDLPSDPGLGRFALARQAGEAVASWEGATRSVERTGMRFERGRLVGFPAPDIIVGDFNIPRGAASLGEFLRVSGAGPMSNAFSVAGYGWARTWPREHPVWAIDQCFVSERVGVGRFRTTDPGVGGHRTLVVDTVVR